MPRRRRPHEEALGRAADDRPDQALGRRVGGAAGVDHPPVAEDDEAVGDREDLVEAVRDVDHADALRLELAQHAEEDRDLALRQARRRLVEDEDAGVDPEGAGDGDERLLGAGQVADPEARVDVVGDQRQRAPRHRLDGLPVDEAAAAGIALGDGDVLADGHPLDETEVLVDEGDAAAVGVGIVGGAVEGHGAGVGRVDAREHLDEGRLAGAVLAEEREDLAPAQVEADVGDGARAAEGLGHSVEGQDRRRCIRIRACDGHVRQGRFLPLRCSCDRLRLGADASQSE